MGVTAQLHVHECRLDLWPSRAIFLDLSRCSVVQTNSLVVRQPHVDSFVFSPLKTKLSRLPATTIEVSKSRLARKLSFKTEILSIQTWSNINFCLCCKFQRVTRYAMADRKIAREGHRSSLHSCTCNCAVTPIWLCDSLLAADCSWHSSIDNTYAVSQKLAAWIPRGISTCVVPSGNLHWVACPLAV